MTNSEKSGATAAYKPDVFEVQDLAAAMQIILTPEPGTTTQERWEYETPFLVDAIGSALGLDEHSCVLDYGCGVGRLAKGLIERYGCHVLGVDISTSMRQLAPGYVKSARFSVCTPEMLECMTAQGLRVTHACACWVLQHCLAPDTDLARIDAALAPGGGFFVLNGSYRSVPTDQGWASDGIAVETLLTQRFEAVARGDLPEVISTPELARTSFTMTLRKRA